GALVTTAQDQWMTMPGSVLALNTYEEITIESWYTPASGANTGYSMLAYFGETVGTSGRNFIFVQPARVTNTTRVSISTNSTGAESEASGPEYDDGRLHHVAVTIDAAKIKLYLDGDLIAASALSAENRISGVSQSLAFLCKSGYTSDPEWIGKIHEFNIYNCALTAGEVFYLYKH
ncbi:MAG: LamG domain-containing protein, partial [Sedimentisphaerales bacterium]|nr:LamG domain-containing protein [Sedimentisphaerales bacterium]